MQPCQVPPPLTVFATARRPITVLLCLLLTLSCLVPRVTAASDPLLSATTDGDPRFGAVEAFAAPRYATAIGVRWERVVFWWKAMQPDGPNSWNLWATGRDHFIHSEVAAGRKLAGLLINTPDWAAANPSEHEASAPSGLYLPYNDPHNYWGHFVALMAKRYAGQIDDWVIWNEVTIPHGQWHTWQGTPADYAQLIKVAYLAAKAANPHARIVLFGDPYWYDYGAFFTDLLRRLTSDPQSSANHAYFDVANLHLYSGPSGFAPIVNAYRGIMARFGLHKPIWVGETNATPYDDPVRRLVRGHFYASMADQASFIIEAFAVFLAAGVERMEVNRMVDGNDFTKGGDPMGLVRNDGTVRPAFLAFRTASNLLSHVTGGTIAIDKASGVYTVTLHKPGATVTVLWDQQPVAVSASIPALGEGAVAYDKFGNGHPISPSNGRYSFHLDGATGNTNSVDPTIYVMGGNPAIVVQRTTF